MVILLLKLEDIVAAQEAINGIAKRTPLKHSEFLSELCDGEVFLKLENLQVTGSFKIRGALNKISSLSTNEKSIGVVAASSGNHALAVAHAAQHWDIPATILVPDEVAKVKLEKLHKYNASILQAGGFEEVEPKARALAREEGISYVSPYNDEMVIAGQGTIGLEILDEESGIDTVICPVGGGGMISGIALALTSASHTIRVTGVSTKGAPTLYISWKAGKIVHVKEGSTLAEAFLGGIEDNAITFDLIQKYVDELVLVEEHSIRDAMRLAWRNEGQMIEGAGATPIAYILENHENLNGKTICAVVSGGNIDEAQFKQIVES